MRKKYTYLIQLFTAFVFTVSLFASTNTAQAYTSLSSGDLIKLPDDGNPNTTVDTSIYYYGADGLRYVFPNSKTYFTWYTGFSNVKTVDAVQLGTIPIGGNVTYRPGVKMIKIESDPKVYAVDRGGARRWVGSEAVAQALYGSNWSRQIDDVGDAFFSNYPEGTPVTAASEFIPSTITNLYNSISADKQMAPPIEVIIGTDGMFSLTNIMVTTGRTVRWTNSSGVDVRVASNPHPAHTDVPGLDSANLPTGLNYVYRFRNTGTFAVHNHLNPTNQMTITVQ